ncbi:cupin domain-containing protein [Vibrio sonorensis]|uniref:cupin domain-containing protein n=1 Tax=Vibrio sonorensis TaxID=1004316 RepID=UPI0008D9190B|nr:cupin domain-containing protein [Vibrio sonorensis]
MSKINIKEKFQKVTSLWFPHIIAESNGQLVKIAKGEGELVWHSHENEDELFIVFKGKLTLKLRDREIELEPGEMYVVPKGVEHCPVAEQETHFMMIEPAATKHTGNQEKEITVASENQPWI